MGPNPGTDSCRAPEAGFTLMEVMVALAIVAAMLVTLIYTTSYNLDLAGRHEAITVATMLAREKMTEVRRDPIRTLEKKDGKFPEPFEDFEFNIEAKDTSMMGIVLSELSIRVKGRGEDVTLRKILQKSKLGG